MTLLNGYEMQTTFFSDFSIADAFGINAIKEIYDLSFKSWKNDIVFMTELTVVLNSKIWQHYEDGNEEISKLYDELWRKNVDYIYDKFGKDENAMRFYFEVTD